MFDLSIKIFHDKFLQIQIHLIILLSEYILYHAYCDNGTDEKYSVAGSQNFFFHFIFLKDLNQPSLLSSSVFLITVATKSCPSAEDQLEA